MNVVILKGNICFAPELKATTSGKSVVTLRLAVARYNDETDYFDVVLWNKTAEAAARFLQKGSTILVRGTLQNRSWPGADGRTRYVTEVVADAVDFLDKKKSGTDAAPTHPPSDVPQAAPQEAPQATQGTLSAFEGLAPDDELPF